MQTEIVVDEFFLFYLKSIVKTLFDHFLSQKKALFDHSNSGGKLSLLKLNKNHLMIDECRRDAGGRLRGDHVGG